MRWSASSSLHREKSPCSVHSWEEKVLGLFVARRKNARSVHRTHKQKKDWARSRANKQIAGGFFFLFGFLDRLFVLTGGTHFVGPVVANSIKCNPESESES